jgi:hypothetical protein
VDLPSERAYVVQEAGFKHPEIAHLTQDLFDNYSRSPQTSASIVCLKDHLKGHLQRFVARFHIDVLIVENALSLPMNIPLGLALTEYLPTPRPPPSPITTTSSGNGAGMCARPPATICGRPSAPILPCIHSV